VADESLPQNPPSLLNQPLTGHAPLAEGNMLSNPPFPPVDSVTGQTPVEQAQPLLAEPWPPSPVLSSDQLRTSALLQRPVEEISESLDQQEALSLAAEIARKMIRLQRVLRPSIYNTPESLERTAEAEESRTQGIDGSQSTSQKTTSRQLVSPRRARRATSSISTRRTKRVKRV
jgi:hypothetical protein